MTPQTTDLSNRIRRDLLYQLRWNIPAAIDGTKITTDPPDAASYVPLPNHHLAETSIAEPPLTCIHQVIIKDCAEEASRQNRYLNDESYEDTYRYIPPAPLEIRNRDRSPITLG